MWVNVGMEAESCEDADSDVSVYCYLVKHCIQRAQHNQVILCPRHGNLAHDARVRTSAFMSCCNLACNLTCLCSHRVNVGMEADGGEDGDGDVSVYCYLVEHCIQRAQHNQVIFCPRHGNLGPYFIASDTGHVHSAHAAPDLVRTWALHTLWFIHVVIWFVKLICARCQLTTCFRK